ncbi:hypothetical protein HY570_03925 [Candidatus Micrarchaeota archaeon]|nr:hypothetical protein [Candidatus Micrarchaeota archaeon]
MLIAIAIGSYVIYPLTFVFNFQLIKELNEQILNNKSQLDIFVGNFSYILSLNINDTGEAEKLMAQLTNNKFYDSVNSLVKAITILQSALILQILILPTLSILVTSFAIRELASLLGAEITLSGFEAV